MSNRLDYYFRQRVSEAELDLGFSQLEQADRDLAADLGLTGVLANAVVSPHAPVPDLTVDISAPGVVLDRIGQRIFFSALQNVNVAQDDNGVSTNVSTAGQEKIVSVFVKFDRSLADPRVDGNSLTVFFRRDESFKFIVAQGAEAPSGTAIPPALRSDAILLGDVARTFGQTQILASNIQVARRQDAFVAPGAPNSIRRGRVGDAIADLLGLINSMSAGSQDAASISYAGGGNWADGVTNPATTVEAQLDKIVADLATAAGAYRIGTSAVAGSPNSLSAGTVRSQLDQLLTYINNVAAGVVTAGSVTYGGAGNWADGTTNPGTNAEAQLDKIVADLAALSGAPKIGAAATAGSPNSLPAGTVKSQLDALLGFVNAVSGSTATTASAVSYAGGGSWADGVTNPATNVEAQLDKIISDLAVVSGAQRIGAAATAGSPNSLPAGTVKSQLDALLGFVNSSSGAASAAAVSYAGGGSWADGTTNPATNVEAQLDKIIADLAATAGAARIGAAASGSIPAGTVRSQLDFIRANSASLNAANVWSALQSFNGAAGDTNGAMATTAAPSTRKLLWEITAGGGQNVRFYSGTDGAWEVTCNARWDGSQWVRDIAGNYASKLRMDRFTFTLFQKVPSGSFADFAWDGRWEVVLPVNGVNSWNQDGWHGNGLTTSYAAAQAVDSENGNLGTGCTWKHRFSATPSSITFAVQDMTGVDSGPFSYAESDIGAGVYVAGTSGETTWFYTHVTAS